MGDILRRRGLMKEEVASASGPLHPIPDGTYPKFQNLNDPTYCEITNHNHAHLVVGTSSGNGGCQLSPENWVTVANGDVVELRIQNVVVITDGAFNTTKFTVRNTNGVTIDLTSAGEAFPNGGEFEITSPRNIGGYLCVYLNWKSGTYEIEFDFELYINGVWYC